MRPTIPSKFAEYPHSWTFCLAEYCSVEYQLLNRRLIEPNRVTSATISGRIGIALIIRNVS